MLPAAQRRGLLLFVAFYSRRRHAAALAAYVICPISCPVNSALRSALRTCKTPCRTAATAMTEPRFDYESNKWASGQADVGRRWYDELENTGVENVRAILARTNAGSPGAILIGSEMIVIGFAQHWLAWHDRQRAEREASFRQWQIFWSRWTALAATAAALVAAIGWIVTALLKGRE